MHTTPRLALQVPDGTEIESNFPAEDAATLAILDAAVLTSQGTLSGRPGIGAVPNGYVYTCTDLPVAFVSVNGAWLGIPLGGGTVPVGGIIDYAGTTVPTDQTGAVWHICDGTAISRTTYAVLFAAIGTSYGFGDGSTTFGLPDLRGRSTIGAGAGAGLTSRALSSMGGAESVLLTAAQSGTNGNGTTVAVSTGGQSADHSHSFGGAAVPTYGGGGNAGPAGGGFAPLTATAGVSNDHTHVVPSTGLNARNADATHSVMQPFAALNRAIRIL